MRPGSDARPITLDAFVERLQRSPRTRACVQRVERIPAREAQYGDFADEVPGWLRETLARRGMGQPYSHQAAAWGHIFARRHTVIVTPTASGKTLCYNVPIATMLRDSDDGCALYVYPTKALAQDQCAELNALLREAGIDEPGQVYDGDTPHELRRRVRETTRAVLTNPDMLHTSILPNHEKWRRVFATLRYVVIDEAHTYRGVFGSHVANVVRRLRRICRFYGADPVFVFASATIANPDELCARLVGASVAVVAESGAPRGEKIVMLYNPPLMNVELQRRQSPGAAAHGIVARLLEAGHASIVFTRSRQGVEVLTRRLKERFEDSRNAQLAGRISGYRGGYLPDERRRIERGLRDGSIMGVVSTNALELGVDIGSLDVCVIAGYPGTIASTWQQAGRAGRRRGTSLAVLIAGDDAVDQFMMLHPDFFLGASPEHARIDPDNLRVLAEHLKCAVFELPMAANEGFGELPVEDVQEILAWLSEDAGLMTLADGAWRWSTQGYPAQTVNIRDIYDENFVIIDETAARPQILGEIDFLAAHKTVYEKAIYQHAAKLFEVERLDYPDRKAYVRRVDCDYFTQAIDQTRVFVLDVCDEARETERDAHRGWGEVRICTRFVGYKKIRFRTWENIGYGEINLPDIERHTTSYWAVFPSAALDRLGLDARAMHGGLQGVAQLMHTVAIVHLMCARDDLLMEVQSRDSEAWLDQPAAPSLRDSTDVPAQDMENEHAPVPLSEGGLLDEPAVFLYDRYPGGVGFSERLFDLHGELLQGALELVEGCSCDAGCPRCVGPPSLVTESGKTAARTILRSALRMRS